MSDEPEARILRAWRDNAAPWTRVVRARGIESRRLVTDAAVLAAVRAFQPRSVLDLGCGEGWLAHALGLDGIAVTGIDAEPALVERARERSGPEFHVMDYARLRAGGLAGRRFDVAVANFSLLGEHSVADALAALPPLLGVDGHLVLQTLHPPTAAGDLPYEDGWREGTWAGIRGDFGAPAPWYFRTTDNWLALLDACGLRVVTVAEPAHPATGLPVSLLIVASPLR